MVRRLDFRSNDDELGYGADNPLRIETDRLVIRAIDEDDLSTFHAIAGRREIALMLASIPHPLSLDAARDWVAERVYRGRNGFSAGIYRRDGTLVGCIGLVNKPPTVNYFLGPEHWGKGYATEALVAFLDWCAERFRLTEIRAGALHDNVGSHRVLEKAGFRFTHIARHQPPIRPEPDRLLMYWKGFGAPEPLAISTERLYLHPIHPAHAARLSQLGDDPLVARMLTFIELPFTPERARTWITPKEDNPDVHRLAISNVEGHLVGACALAIIGRLGAITGWIGRGWWHSGYGGEAARGLITIAFARFPALERLECCIMHDNATAMRIMENLGFEQTGQNFATSPTRDERTLEYLYRLKRSRFEGAV
jgi:RimJ/RimL family protein N-acetyltransferase